MMKTTKMSQARRASVASDRETTARIISMFEAKGLRSTRQRRLIAERLAALATSGADFTAQDLWHDLQRYDAHLGRATVYRAVDVLLEEGFLDRVSFADGTHRYRTCGAAHHHHVTCMQCQRVVEVDVCLPSALLATISAETDFTIERHSLELYGRCAACREQRPGDRGA